MVTPGRVRFLPLPPRGTIERAVKDYRALIARQPKGSQFDAWQAPAEAPYSMLIKPALPDLASQRPLVIVPDGLLHYLPFETLRTAGRDGRPQCLVEQFAVSYMPSVSVISRHATTARSQRPRFSRSSHSLDRAKLGRWTCWRMATLCSRGPA